MLPHSAIRSSSAARTACCGSGREGAPVWRAAGSAGVLLWMVTLQSLRFAKFFGKSGSHDPWPGQCLPCMHGHQWRARGRSRPPSHTLQSAHFAKCGRVTSSGADAGSPVPAPARHGAASGTVARRTQQPSSAATRQCSNPTTRQRSSPTTQQRSNAAAQQRNNAAMPEPGPAATRQRRSAARGTAGPQWHGSRRHHGGGEEHGATRVGGAG